MKGRMWMVERLKSECQNMWPKGQDQIAKIRESIYEGITNSNWLNRDSQNFNYNI